MQALEFVLTRIVILPGQMINRCQCVCVMGRELRVDQIRNGEQFFRAGQIRDIGIHFAGINRIALQPFHLRAFDFAIPVGAFHQTNHQPTAATGGQID
ncbi:Uncharacterised protein [Salmonella enterica subsp. enterica serovar Bovismorbificans]|uniref:Uncharacterized protein n=1 Tax=Salmonella enterica subsp. enterica serovar Bovismorbificans TaxID=58097 RepID=A0A655CA74_SALET|nr:Uncharacterised protein [Salmonella enterica subsp. enterica serovar Bovismorbificans]